MNLEVNGWFPSRLLRVFDISCHERKCLGFCSIHLSKSVVRKEGRSETPSASLPTPPPPPPSSRTSFSVAVHQLTLSARDMLYEVMLLLHQTCVITDQPTLQQRKIWYKSERVLFLFLSLMDVFCYRSAQSTWTPAWTQERIKLLLLARDYFIGLLLSRPTIWWSFFQLGEVVLKPGMLLCFKITILPFPWIVSLWDELRINTRPLLLMPVVTLCKSPIPRTVCRQQWTPLHKCVL